MPTTSWARLSAPTGRQGLRAATGRAKASANAGALGVPTHLRHLATRVGPTPMVRYAARRHQAPFRAPAGGPGPARPAERKSWLPGSGRNAQRTRRCRGAPRHVGAGGSPLRRPGRRQKLGGCGPAGRASGTGAGLCFGGPFSSSSLPFFVRPFSWARVRRARGLRQPTFTLLQYTQDYLTIKGP